MNKIKSFFYDIKTGMMDVKNMLLEGNYKLFLTPVACVIVLFIIVHYFSDKTAAQVRGLAQKIDAQKAEINNEQEYRNSKAEYENLIRRLPPAEERNEWLLANIDKILSANSIVATRVANQETTTSGIFTIASVTVNMQLSYSQLGKLVEAIENADYFVRISDLNIQRKEGRLGYLDVTLKLNTLFVDNSGEGARGPLGAGGPVL
jgi:Tfp pilus assembly protein PilO